MIDTESRTYSHLWNKYRPAILKLMVEAADESRQYKLYAHEFASAGNRKKTGFDFTLRLSNGRAMNSIKESAVAQDLLYVLQSSAKAAELTGSATYEIVMDKHFVLHITRISIP